MATSKNNANTTRGKWKMNDKYTKIAKKYPMTIALSPRSNFEKQLAKFLRKHFKGLNK